MYDFTHLCVCCSAVLSTLTLLHNRPPELFHPAKLKLCTRSTLNPHSPSPSPWCPPFCFPSLWIWLFLFLFFKDFVYLFLEREEGKEKERERKINVWLPLERPLLGTWPTTQACALTGNRTGHPLVHRLVLNPLSHTSQGGCDHFYCCLLYTSDAADDPEIV